MRDSYMPCIAMAHSTKYYSGPVLRAVGIMDIGQLHKDILSTQRSHTYISEHNSEPQWSTDEQGLVRYNDWIWVPDSNDLRLQVLHYIISIPYVYQIFKWMWEYLWESIRDISSSWSIQQYRWVNK